MTKYSRERMHEEDVEKTMGDTDMRRWCLVDHRYRCFHPDMLVEYDKDVGGSFMLDVRCEAKRCTLRAKLQKSVRGR